MGRPSHRFNRAKTIGGINLTSQNRINICMQTGVTLDFVELE